MQDAIQQKFLEGFLLEQQLIAAALQKGVTCVTCVDCLQTAETLQLADAFEFTAGMAGCHALFERATEYTTNATSDRHHAPQPACQHECHRDTTESGTLQRAAYLMDNLPLSGHRSAQPNQEDRLTLWQFPIPASLSQCRDQPSNITNRRMRSLSLAFYQSTSYKSIDLWHALTRNAKQGC